MSDAARQLLDAALALSDRERADLAAQLIASLDERPDPDWAAAWDAEVRQRLGELDGGQVQTISWAEARLSRARRAL